VSDDTTTIPVTVTVDSVEPLRSCGKLVAVATVVVAIECKGDYLLELPIAGVQIRTMPDGSYGVRGPAYRHPRTGQLTDIWPEFPPELRTAIGRELIAVMTGQS
jgi:hypothetical protein